MSADAKVAATAPATTDAPAEAKVVSPFRVFIGNLSYETDNDKLRTFFSALPGVNVYVYEY